MRKKKDTREKLLQASLKLISAKGYLATTTRDIAKEAGVSEITLFRHFGTKERLFEKLLQDFTLTPKFVNLAPELENLGARDALELIAMRYLDTLMERKQMIKHLHAEVFFYPENIKAVYNNFIHELQSMISFYFKTLQKKGVFRSDMPADMAGRMFQWIFISYFRMEEILSPGGIKKNVMKKQVRDIVGIFLLGVAAKVDAG